MPFGYLNVSTPCNVSTKLKINRIDLNICVSSAYDHRREIWVAYVKGKSVFIVKHYKSITHL